MKRIITYTRTIDKVDENHFPIQGEKEEVTATIISETEEMFQEHLETIKLYEATYTVEEIKEVEQMTTEKELNDVMLANPNLLTSLLKLMEENKITV